MKAIVAIIWSLLLLVSYLLVVPVVVALLQRALHAARQIERYTAEILASGGGIAQNTAHVAALKDTLAAAPQLLSAAESLERHAATVETALASTDDGHVPGTGDGHVEGEEAQP
jgi:hypothetical protein